MDGVLNVGTALEGLAEWYRQFKQPYIAVRKERLHKKLSDAAKNRKSKKS